MDLSGEQTPLIGGSSSNKMELQVSGAAENNAEMNIDGRDKVKVYWWRWVVLIVLVANMSVNIAIWIGFGPIAEILKCYYKISDFWVNSFSMVFMLTYTLFILPSFWLLERVGLRATAVIAACGNAAGACLKIAGVVHQRSTVRVQNFCMDSRVEKLPILRSKACSRNFQASGVGNCPQKRNGDEIKVYKWRWIVLAVFVTNMTVTNAIWIAFGPIADVVKCYYNISNFWVNSVSMVYMLTYILFIVPSAWLLVRVGLRSATIIATCLNAAGACLKLAGVGPEYFWILLSGQTIASLSNLLLWGIPSYVAGIWFPSSERGIAAASVGAFAPQLGVLISYVLAPLIVHSDHTATICSGNATDDMQRSWTDTIYNQLLYYTSTHAGLSLILVIATIIAVPTAPPTPPSRSQELVESTQNLERANTLRKMLRAIFTNGYFLLLLLTASISIGASGAIVSLFNELIHPYFEDRDEDVLYIGLTTQIPALAAVLVIGPILGRTKAFYLMNVIVYVVTFLSIGGFLAALEFQSNFNVLYPLVALIGASVTGFQAIVYEYAAEMTYPLPEGISGGLVNWVSQPVAILMVIVGPKFGTVNGHKVPVAWTIAALTLVGMIVTVFIRPKLRKTNIDTKKSTAQPAINEDT